MQHSNVDLAEADVALHWPNRFPASVSTVQMRRHASIASGIGLPDSTDPFREALMLSISEQGDPAGDAPGSIILLQEFNHRILNEYTVAIASLSIAKSRIENVEARSALSAVQDRLHAMVGVHRALQAPLTGSVAIAGHITRVCEAASQALASNCRLVLQTEALEITLSAARAWRVGLILIELVTNAVKHGRPGGEVIVNAHATDEAFVCSVANESCGPGKKDGGAGQTIIEILASQIGGHLRHRTIGAHISVDLEVPVCRHLEVTAMEKARAASRRRSDVADSGTGNLRLS